MDIVCRCGHPRDLHFHKNGVSGCQKRLGWGIEGTRYADDCREYHPDNLTHIEWLAKERKLI
jgi:hypothetical protein